MNKPSPFRQQQTGFTIAELMIATSIMSIMLLLATAFFMHLGGEYTKGAQLANTQNVARNIIDSISRQLQFSAEPLVSNTGASPKAFCIGTSRYSFVINQQQGTNPGQSPHILWQDTLPSLPANSAACAPLGVTSAGTPPPGSPSGTGGKEMVPSLMRLTGLCVTPTSAGSTLYLIDVWVAYGDNTLLGPVAGSTNDSCGDQHYHCLGGPSDEYCAVSELETTIDRRIAQ